MAQAYPITGLEGTGRHPRLELRDLMKNDIQFSLFIRAMTNIQELRSEEDRQRPNSWWQMGSIHGLPYDPWSGDPNGPQKEDSESQWGGYCYHGSALFPSWHRVHVLLVEQAVVQEAIKIACEFEAEDSDAQTEEWVERASALRLPFWDWTKNETAIEGIPKVCRETEITIVNPGGSNSRVPNPLNHYKYAGKPGVATGLEYMGTWDRTYRWVDRNLNPTKEDYDQAAMAFSQGTTLDLAGEKFDLQPVTWLRQKVHGLFTYDLTIDDPAYGPNMWAYFSNTGAADHGVYAPMDFMPSSIEESHNMVHLNVGGNGSMSANEYASYDPMFFLHHCNVDRIYSFWEYLYPEYWIGDGWKNKESGQVVPFTIDTGTFWQPRGATINRSTPLHPFRNRSLDHWTSDQTRSLLCDSPVNMYYTYPPITDPRTGLQVQVDIPYDVDDLPLRKQFQQVLLGEWGPDFGSIARIYESLPSSLSFLDLLWKQENGLAHLRQFIIVGRLPEFAFHGSYRLELYVLPKVERLATGVLGQATGALEKATGFRAGLVQRGVLTVEDTVTHVVNSITVLGRSDPDRCAACRERRATGSCIRGYMQLDPRLVLCLIASLDATGLESITELNHLCALFEGSLGMRLVKPDGTKLVAAEPDATDCTPVEEAKLPKLTLHSQIIHFDPSDPKVPVVCDEQTTHGTFGANYGWF